MNVALPEAWTGTTTFHSSKNAGKANRLLGLQERESNRSLNSCRKLCIGQTSHGGIEFAGAGQSSNGVVTSQGESLARVPSGTAIDSAESCGCGMATSRLSLADTSMNGED